MENCMVCLKSDEDIFSRITATSTEWIENKIQKIIEKHLWWWYLKTSNENSILVPWICRQCWQEVSAFHNFYIKVEKAHRHYQPILSSLDQVKEEQQLYANPKTGEVFHVNADSFLPESENYIEKIIDVEEVKVEYCPPSNENLSDKSLDVNAFDESSLGAELLLKDAENTQRGRNKKNNENKPRERRTKKSKNTTQNITTKKENLRYKTSQVDTFFEENEHSLECCICNVPLPDFRSIRSHYRIEHNTRGYALCCGKKYFKRCMLVDHLRVHKDPNYFRCESCAKSFETRRGLEIHIETHKVRERKYNCDECGKSYFKLSIYQRHKLTHIPDIEKEYKCSQCEKKFASDELRRRHEYSIHARQNAKVCHICGKSFSFRYSFSRHMEEHAGIPQPMVTCDICGVKLTNKYGLRQHMKMRHVEENMQEQICPYCSRVSPNINAHRKHIKYSHTMQRNHACHLCEKAFRRPLELKEHLSTHSGKPLYTCPHCPRTFISNANMHKHRKIAHRVEWEESRAKKLNKSRCNNVLTSSSTDNDKEVGQICTENPTLPITDPFISSFSKYLENKDN